MPFARRFVWLGLFQGDSGLPLPDGHARWRVIVHPHESGLPSLICMVSPTLDFFKTFYVVPAAFLRGNATFCTLGEDQKYMQVSHKLASLSQFCDAVLSISTGATHQPIAHTDGIVTLEYSPMVTLGKREV